MDSGVNLNEQQCLQILKSSVNDCEELTEFSDLLDDRFLLHFVRGRKYDSQRAFETLRNYFYIRRVKYLKLFKMLRPSDAPLLDNRVVRVLKQRDKFQRIVYIVDFDRWDPSVVTLNDFCLGLILIFEEAWNSPQVDENGFVGIFDCRQFNFHHFRMWTPSNLAKCISIFWNNLPVKYKKLYILTNPKRLVSWAYQILKPILPQKVKDRMSLLGIDRSELFENMCLDMLPKSIGGNLSDEDAYDLQMELRIQNKEDFYQAFSEKL